ncbi:MAG: hypothetical protein GPJ54_20615 [Candidatus Heimdallarchaeota archaeon]|nr:hypothetical protein [Candidatus Heimdallarchaeota archaeon]
MLSDHHISYLPTDGLSYDPTEEIYWDKDAFKKELLRAYELCHECRMCFKYCNSFPILFTKVDENDGDVRKVTDEDTVEIMNACFQCKLCEVQCPYTPKEDHEFKLDFPKLVHRYNAIRARDNGNTFRDKFFSNPDRIAKISRASLGIANFANSVHIFRVINEKILGIHRDKILPKFPLQTFDKWAANQGLISDEKSELTLFQTCYVQNNEPDIGKDTIKVLEKNQIKTTCSKGLNCCGMPSWEIGDIETVRKNAKHNLDILIPKIEAGAKVGVINPTCSMMMRNEYPELLEGEDRERAKILSDAITDVSEYVWSIRNEDRFNIDFKSTPDGDVAYHVPCHLRAQRIGFPSRGLMKKVTGVKVLLNMECSGHDGTYAMKKESFDDSLRIGKKSFDGMQKDTVKAMVSDCPLACTQFEQGLGTKALHPMSFLAKAYREDGFENKITKEK